MSWGRPPKVNIWSTDDWTDLPRLVLSRATFKNNKATAHGGAIAFTGPVQGAGLVLETNDAQSVGAAIASWQAATLPAPYNGIADAMSTNTDPVLPDALTLTRSVLVDNHAGQSGAALATANAQTAVGNSIIARNRAPGATVTGVNLRLVNTVIADNAAVGIRTEPGGTVAMGNSVVLHNTANCASGTAPAVIGTNMQYPGGDCGSQIQTTDPGLDGTYTPGLISAARNAGNIGLCISEPTVAGIDLHGSTRISADHKCAVGAIERDLLDSAAAALTFDHTQNFGHCLMWLLILLPLTAFILGFIWRIRKRRKSAKSAQ
jgi:predicted outer membrane repeat protein